MAGSSPTRIPGIAQLKSFVGAALGTSDWVTLDQERIDRFAEATGDRQWIHVDVERAKRESRFGETIAHGYLTLALAPALIPKIFVVEDISMVVNYGVDKVRLPAPVPAGSRVRLSARIKAVRQVPGGAARVVFAFEFELEGSAKPACIADAVYVYFP